MVELTKETIKSTSLEAVVGILVARGIGVGVDGHGHDASHGGTGSRVTGKGDANQMLGLTAVILACLSSGFASTYFERVLKAKPSATLPSTPLTGLTSVTTTSSSSFKNFDPSLPSPPPPPPQNLGVPSIWIRNIQLSLFGLLFGLPIVIYDILHSLPSPPASSISSYLPESLSPTSQILRHSFPVRGETQTGWNSLVAIIQNGLGEQGWGNAGRGTLGTLGGIIFEGFDGMTWFVVALQVTGGLLGGMFPLFLFSVGTKT